MIKGGLKYYILFENYEQRLALHDVLDSDDIPNRIAPAPRAIQGFIRKVGEGRTPSREAVEYAEALGYSLAPDETYVKPFIRRVLRLKQKEAENTNG